MKGETKSAGFTIVETLIVLAVTSALFVSVMLLINGKQNTAQFQQSVRDIQTKVQQTINEVSTGYYPNPADFTCKAGPDPLGGQMPRFNNSSSQQGTNQDCIFLGKIIQFAVNGNTVPQEYNTYSIAGLSSATDLASAHAVVIDLPQVTQTDTLSYGLTVKSMCYSGGANCLSPLTNATNSVGFISEIGDLGSSKTYESGTVNLVSLAGLDLTANDTATKNRIDGSHLQPPIGVSNPAGGVAICFQGRNASDTAILTIGSDGHNLGVKLNVKAC